MLVLSRIFAARSPVNKVSKHLVEALTRCGVSETRGPLTGLTLSTANSCSSQNLFALSAQYWTQSFKNLKNFTSSTSAPLPKLQLTAVLPSAPRRPDCLIGTGLLHLSRKLSTAARPCKHKGQNIARRFLTTGRSSLESYQVAASSDFGGLSSEARSKIAIWLGVCTAWVFSMVVLGGLTRLTRSGLSMTEWRFAGEVPPLNEEDWKREFWKYQQSPEFKRVNRSMSEEDFKFIYWMEFAHRWWGRLLGFVFLVPGAYFLARGHLNAPLSKRLALLFLMGGSQGLVGWWMVRSGLEEPKAEYETPRVSPYRLAAHLGSAFAIYSLLLWTTLSLGWPAAKPQSLPTAQLLASTALRRRVLPLTGLVALTALSGAFVAGTDAGHAYNTFPLMGGHIIPEEYWAVPGWQNAFENTAAVQFHHRVLAMSTLAATLLVYLRHRRSALPKATFRLLQSIPLIASLQVALGVSALLAYVPPSLGAAHQANALLLFSALLALMHSLKSFPAASKPLPWRLKGLPAAVLALAGGAALYQNNVHHT